MEMLALSNVLQKDVALFSDQEEENVEQRMTLSSKNWPFAKKRGQSPVFWDGIGTTMA
jgi:hypothetical protein